MRATGPSVLLAGLVTGILLGDRLAPGPAIGALIASLLAAAGAFACRAPLRLLVGVVAVALLGTALTQRAHDGLANSPLAAAVDERADVRVVGTLVDDPEGDQYSARVLVRLHSMWRRDRSMAAPGDGGDRSVLVAAAGDVGSRLRLLSAGDRVELDGWLQPLRGPDSRFRWRHAAAMLDATTLVSFGEPRSPGLRLANALRDRVLGGSERLPAPERSLVSGFLLGDTRSLPYSVEADFRDAGLSHLLAVSGANVAFVLALAGPVLRRLSLRGRLVGGLAVVGTFGSMTRWEPSVLRACAMAACAMTAVHLGRPSAGLRVLLLSVLALLVVDPFLIHSIGFLLSCGASAGITVFGTRFTEWLRGPGWFREGMGVTLAAQLGVAPVLLPVFGSMPLVTLPANLLTVPAAAPLTVYGLLSGVASSLLTDWWPGLAEILQLPTLALARYVRGVAELGAQVPLHVDGRVAIPLAAALALAAGYRRVRRGTASTLGRHERVPAR